MSLSKLWELVMDKEAGVLQFMGRKESDMTEQQNWTELKSFPVSYDLFLLKAQYLHKGVLAINLIVNPKDIIQRTN